MRSLTSRRTRLVGAAAALVLGVSRPTAQMPTFTSRANVVLVDALVTDGRMPVTDLGPDDFELRDNGVPQKIARVSQGQVPLGVVLAMDTSGSVTGVRLSALQAAAGSVVAALQPADRLAVVAFGSRVRWRQLTSITPSAVADALQPVPDPGDTSLFDAAYTALTLGESPGTRGLAIVFSDGVDTSSVLPAASVVDIARRADVVVFGVSVGGPTQSFLDVLSSATGGRTLRVESDRTLGAALASIVAEFRSRYLISYTPVGVAQGGWHRLELRVKGRRVTVNARPGYQY